MEMQMVKHSYQAAFGILSANAACTVGSIYTRVWFGKDGDVIVRENCGKNGRFASRKVTGQKAAKIVAFVKENLEQAK